MIHKEVYGEIEFHRVISDCENDWAGSYNLDPSLFDIEALTRNDAGEMARIISKTSAGILWVSSLGQCWTLNIKEAQSLVSGWDGVSSIRWAWAIVKPGGAEKHHVEVSPEKMAEIKAYLESLPGEILPEQEK